VIAGVGVRNYYRKQGYLDEGYFQIKELNGYEIEQIPCEYIKNPLNISLHNKINTNTVNIRYIFDILLIILSFMIFKYLYL
jgi:hypothetical protein